MVRPPVQPVQQMIPNAQPLAQNMAAMRPGVYNASTYRPTTRRVGGVSYYRPIGQNLGNAMGNPGEYATRTYRPRKL